MEPKNTCTLAKSNLLIRLSTLLKINYRELQGRNLRSLMSLYLQNSKLDTPPLGNLPILWVIWFVGTKIGGGNFQREREGESFLIPKRIGAYAKTQNSSSVLLC